MERTDSKGRYELRSFRKSAKLSHTTSDVYEETLKDFARAEKSRACDYTGGMVCVDHITALDGRPAI